MNGLVWIQQQPEHERTGRFAPGVSGNPAGKRKGTLNRMTQLKLALSVDEGGAVARAVIDRALAGDRVAQRLCFAAILPKGAGEADRARSAFLRFDRGRRRGLRGDGGGDGGGGDLAGRGAQG
jgi:hypothetical protein